MSVEWLNEPSNRYDLATVVADKMLRNAIGEHQL